MYRLARQAPQAVKGKMQEGERLLPRSRRAGAGSRRETGSGETEAVSPGAAKKNGPGRIRGHVSGAKDYAAFFVLLLFFAGAALTGGFFSALAFSLAANSCLTLAWMASVSTL
jgi:hypothetical protein